MLVGLVQVLFGTFVVSGSLTLMFRQFSIEELLGCLLGAFLIYQGVWMVGQQERRRRNRREELRRTMIAPGTRETLG
ncbi:hypothetical protein [Deinococcus sp.]|uniref:hypothetical protein n=1 Tax=Deinococcus sp. TaxID=47478 RepID=UPI003C7EA608